MNRAIGEIGKSFLPERKQTKILKVGMEITMKYHIEKNTPENGRKISAVT